MRLRPNASTINGVIATSGTDRSRVATGMWACSAERDSTNRAATTTAPTIATRRSRLTASKGSSQEVKMAPPIVFSVPNDCSSPPDRVATRLGTRAIASVSSTKRPMAAPPPSTRENVILALGASSPRFSSMMTNRKSTMMAPA